MTQNANFSANCAYRKPRCIQQLDLIDWTAFPSALGRTVIAFAKERIWTLLAISYGSRTVREYRIQQFAMDMLGTKEKEMIWVENTTRRFKDGYNYFGRYPEKVLAFFERYMK